MKNEEHKLDFSSAKKLINKIIENYKYSQELSDEIIDYIVQHINKNLTNLEHVIKRIFAYALINNYDEISLHVVKDCIEDYEYKLEKNNKMRLYYLDKDKVLDYVLRNYDVLKGLDIKEIKQIEQDYDRNIYILMNNGDIYLDHKIIMSNIDKVYFLDANRIYAITNESEVLSLNAFDNDLSEYINNNGYKYKKIVTATLGIACLTYEGDVRAITCGFTAAFIPENFKNITDIEVSGELEDIIVYHKDTKKWSKLYID